MSTEHNVKTFLALPFVRRVELATSMKTKYPTRIPVIIMPKKLEAIKIKYLVPDDITFAQFQLAVRKNLPELKKEQSLFFLINNSMVNNSSLMNSIYNQYKSNDQFLYIQVCTENVFG